MPPNTSSQSTWRSPKVHQENHVQPKTEKDSRKPHKYHALTCDEAAHFPWLLLETIQPWLAQAEEIFTRSLRYGCLEGKKSKFSVVVQPVETIAPCSKRPNTRLPYSTYKADTLGVRFFLFWRETPSALLWVPECWNGRMPRLHSSSWSAAALRGHWGASEISPLLNCQEASGGWLRRHWNTEAAATTGWCKFYWDNIQTGHGNKGFDAGTSNVKRNTKIKRH